MIFQILFLIIFFDLMGCAWVDYRLMELECSGDHITRECLTKRWWM